VHFYRGFRSCRLRNPADRQRVIVPAASQPRRLRPGNQHPAHAELRLQALEIPKLEVRPARLGHLLQVPFRSQAGHLRHHRRVLVGIGQLAPLGQRPEAVKVFARRGKVLRVEGKVGVGRSVLANPRKGLQPGV